MGNLDVKVLAWSLSYGIGRGPTIRSGLMKLTQANLGPSSGYQACRHGCVLSIIGRIAQGGGTDGKICWIWLGWRRNRSLNGIQSQYKSTLVGTVNPTATSGEIRSFNEAVLPHAFSMYILTYLESYYFCATWGQRGKI